MDRLIKNEEFLSLMDIFLKTKTECQMEQNIGDVLDIQIVK